MIPVLDTFHHSPATSNIFDNPVTVLIFKEKINNIIGFFPVGYSPVYYKQKDKVLPVIIVKWNKYAQCLHHSYNHRTNDISTNVF